MITESPFAAGYPAHVLHIEPRPFLTPCARCGTHDHIDDQAPTHANIDGHAVCARCINDLQLDTLIAVQRVDAAYSEIAGATTDPGTRQAGSEYLAAVACGVLELLAYYGTRDDLLRLQAVVNVRVSQSGYEPEQQPAATRDITT